MTEDIKVHDVRVGKTAELPANIGVFQVEYRDPDTGTMHSGEFQVRRLTIGDIRRVELKKAELNGGLPDNQVNETLKALNTMLAHLSISLQKYPAWWKPEEFYNGDIIVRVYERIMQFEDSFRSSAQRQSEGAQGYSSSSYKGTITSTHSMVVPEVSPVAEIA